jgi:hypothetical protein
MKDVRTKDTTYFLHIFFYTLATDRLGSVNISLHFYSVFFLPAHFVVVNLNWTGQATAKPEALSFVLIIRQYFHYER